MSGSKVQTLLALSFGLRLAPRRYMLRRSVNQSAAIRALAVFVLASISSSFSMAAAAQTTYWRVSLDRVTVVANVSGERCNRLATQVILFERVLHTLANFDSDYQLPPITLYSPLTGGRRALFDFGYRTTATVVSGSAYLQQVPAGLRLQYCRHR